MIQQNCSIFLWGGGGGLDDILHTRKLKVVEAKAGILLNYEVFSGTCQKLIAGEGVWLKHGEGYEF